MVLLNKVWDFSIVQSEWLLLHIPQTPRGRSGQRGAAHSYKKYQVMVAFWWLMITLLTVKLIPIVSCWRRILSVMSSSRRPIEGFSRLIVGDKPQRTRAGHTCPTHSQSLALAIGIPLYIPRRQYRAPCEKKCTCVQTLKEILGISLQLQKFANDGHVF